jgi:hypothetical protein
MMRALAVLSAAAVALFALPSTAGAAGDSVADVSAVSESASHGAVSFLAARSLFGLSLGAVLWLSVAAVAALVALVALARSRGHLAAAASTSDGSVVRADFGLVDAAPVAR